MKTTITVLALCLLLPGCATSIQGSQQNITIQTQNDASDKTLCTAQNEEGVYRYIKPDRTAIVYRDGNPLQIECKNDTQHGSLQSEPEFQGRYMFMDFLLIDACIISCIVDGMNNAFYAYPDTVTVMMQDGKPHD